MNSINSLPGRAVPGLFAALLMLLLAGCAAVTPWKKPPPDYALAPRADSAFAPIEAHIARQHGSEISGFHLLENNAEALKWRIALIDSARHSLDLQYYVWFGDEVGHLMMKRVIAAADRGVKVRILFDDLNTMLHDMATVEIRDAAMQMIDAHPNIEIRLFNAWHSRTLLGRAFEAVGDFERLNRRMHNKQMIADNRVAVIGGRNIADEYFGLNADFNFHDLDVIGVGPVARQASEVFDRYWNSEWVRKVPRQSQPVAVGQHPSLADTETIRGTVLSGLLDGPRSWEAELAALTDALHPGSSTVHTDSPSRASSTRNHMPDAFRDLLRSAQREVIITNAYIIPDANFMADLRELSGRGVSVNILTNSLASHDVPAVNSHYEEWRRPILDSGAKLHELRADAAVRSEMVDVPPLQAEFVGLHTKAMLVDRERLFIGSMNLDPRSEILNSEMGVIIHSPPLAEALAGSMERDLGGANSWHVTRDEHGVLRWQSDAGEETEQPARNLWQRVEDILFKFFPSDMY
jgi:putative cardiolipin synthase